MIRSTFVHDYLKSSFLWWGIFMLIFTNLSAGLIFNQTLQVIVIYQIYIPILFASLTIAFVSALYPIRRGLRELCLKKETKNYGIMYMIIIGMIFLTESVFFMSDPYVIFGTLSSGIISDKDMWSYTLNTKTLVSFIALPFWQAYSFALIKSKLRKEGYQINDTLNNNRKFVFYIVLVNVVMGIVAVLVTSN